MHPQARRENPASGTGFLPFLKHSPRSQKWKHLPVLPGLPAGCFSPAGCFPDLLRSPEPDSCSSVHLEHFAGSPMPFCDLGYQGSGGTRKRVSLLRAHLPHNPLIAGSIGVYVCQVNLPTQPVLRCHVPFQNAGSAAHDHGRNCFQIEPGFHNCRQYFLRVEPSLPDNNFFCGRVHAAALAVQNTFDLNVRYRQSGISAYLLGDLIHAPDHTKLQAAAGSGVWNTVVQPHQVYGPATDVCEKNRRLVPNTFRVKSQGRVSLWEQFYILNPDLIALILVPETQRLLFPKQIFPETFFLPAKTCQWEAGCQNHICFPLSPVVADLLCNGCHCQKIIIVIGSLASHQRLPPSSTHIKFPIVLQDILHGIRLIIVPGQSSRETHMGSFDGIISMIDSYNDKSPHPFWFFLFFSSRWSFGLEKEKKGRTPKSPAHDICISLRCYLLFVIKSEYYCF